LALLDTSLPGVRQLQQWIRAKTAIQIQLNDGAKLDGTLDWQDVEFLGLRQPNDSEPVLIQRQAVSVIRSLN
jgi:host factor-I protein